MINNMNIQLPDTLHARIYSHNEVAINHHDIDAHALRIIRRLRHHRFKCYLVGGAVRDLIIGKTPKDFDLATNASPLQIRSLFSHSRIIGRRFRLVHIFYWRHKIIEVSTFRSLSDPHRYGNIEEDAFRRDFTVNGLYYDPLDRWVIDYVGGLTDIHNRVLDTVIPYDTIFVEDPMRMVRAIKYATQIDLRLSAGIKRALRTDYARVRDGSSSRITEEFMKILTSGAACDILTNLHRHKLLQYIQPQCAEILQNKQDGRAYEQELRALDGINRRAMGLPKIFAHYLRYPLHIDRHSVYKEVFSAAKRFIAPCTAPNAIISKAVEILMQKQTPRRRRRGR